MDYSKLEELRKGTDVISQTESNVTRLHCFIEGIESIIELPVTEMNQASGWEIGRDSQCDIELDHASVSNRHAQIIHQKGRWKIVNLVSTSGIMINGKKQLSGYLSDGDKIGLGSVNLIFKTPKSAKKNLNQFKKIDNKPELNKMIIPIVLVLMLVLAIVLIIMKF